MLNNRSSRGLETIPAQRTLMSVKSTSASPRSTVKRISWRQSTMTIMRMIMMSVCPPNRKTFAEHRLKRKHLICYKTLCPIQSYSNSCLTHIHRDAIAQLEPAHQIISSLAEMDKTFDKKGTRNRIPNCFRKSLAVQSTALRKSKLVSKTNTRAP